LCAAAFASGDGAVLPPGHAPKLQHRPAADKNTQCCRVFEKISVSGNHRWNSWFEAVLHDTRFQSGLR